MNIILCIKQVINPEIPPGKFRIDSKTMTVTPPEGIPPVINPYDERAVELALRFKEKYGGKITVLTMGSAASAAVVKHALSMGVDDGIALVDPSFENSDSFGIAHVLTKAIQKIGSYDLILCGPQAADWDEGLVGSIIAETLSLPTVTFVKEIDLIENGLKVKRVTLDSSQVFAVSTPALFTISQEVGRPRLPSGWGIISAARKQVPVWSALDIGADLSQLGSGAVQRKLVKLFIAETGRKCEMIQGESVSEAATKLADRLRQVGAI